MNPKFTFVIFVFVTISTCHKQVYAFISAIADKDGCGETCFNGKQSGNGNKADRFIRSPLGTMRFGKRGNAPFNPMRFGKSYDSDDLSTILSMTYENDGNNNAGVNNDYPVFEGNPFYLNSYQKRRNPLGTMRFGK